MAVTTWVMLMLLMGAVVLWKFSIKVRYYMKMTIYAVISVIFATAPIPIMLLKPRDSKNALYVYLYLILYVIYKLKPTFQNSCSSFKIFI